MVKKENDKRVRLASGGRLGGKRGRSGGGNPLVEASPKWAEDNTSTVPYDPAQEITRAKDSDKKIAPSVSTPAPTPPSQSTAPGSMTQTVVDGSTQITKSYVPGAPGDHEPDSFAAAARQGYFQQHGVYPPCLNPMCKSYGKPHTNCLCYGDGSDEAWAKRPEHNDFLAKGGVVGHHFCLQKRAHNPKCEYYADGGDVQEQAPQAPQPVQYQDNPEDTIGHLAVEHGLLGLLKNVGHKKLAEPEKHVKKLHESFANPNREKASEKLATHPLSGTISPMKLHPIMDRLAGPVASQEAHPEAFRNSVEYLSGAVRGHNDLKNHSREIFGAKNFSEKMDPDSKTREELKSHIEDLRKNPTKALEIGGSLGHYLPEHSAGLGAHAARAINYLNSIKPTQAKNGPLDEISPIDKMAEGKYNRALDLAQRPLMAMHFAKDGTLLPEDVKTLSTLYPGLYKSMVSKVSEELIEAQTKGTEIPYKQRMSISMLLGQPLDSTMTPMAMQAIMHANAGAQKPQSEPKKATGVELKQLNKVDAMSETKLQKRQIDDK